MRWIRTKEELPKAYIPVSGGGKFSDEVLICQDGCFYIANLEVIGSRPRAFVVRDYVDYLCGDLEFKINEVTCWAPIPKPPKEWLDDEEEPPA